MIRKRPGQPGRFFVPHPAVVQDAVGVHAVVTAEPDDRMFEYAFRSSSSTPISFQAVSVPVSARAARCGLESNVDRQAPAAQARPSAPDIMCASISKGWVNLTVAVSYVRSMRCDVCPEHDVVSTSIRKSFIVIRWNRLVPQHHQRDGLQSTTAAAVRNTVESVRQAVGRTKASTIGVQSPAIAEPMRGWFIEVSGRRRG